LNTVHAKVHCAKWLRQPLLRLSAGLIAQGKALFILDSATLNA